MTDDQEKRLRNKIITLIGCMDALQSMDREYIDLAIDDLLAACSAAGWEPPTPNSRR